MSRNFLLENSGSHTQASNQQQHSIKVAPVQFFFDDWKKIWFFQKIEKKHSFQHLLTSFRFPQIFEMACKKNVPDYNFFYDNGW